MLNPVWEITNKMLSYASQIGAASEVINMPMAVEWEMRFRDDAITRMVTATLALDGARVTRNEVEKIIKVDAGRDERAEEVALRSGVVARESDIQGILNRQSAYRYVEQLIRLGEKTKMGTFGEKELLQVHSLIQEKIVVSHQLGVYRTAAAEDRDFLSRLYKTPPLSIEVPYQMEDFWSWFRSLGAGEMYPPIKAALATIELCKIMPFSAGNMATIFSFGQLILGIEGMMFKRMISVESVFWEKETEFGNKLLGAISGEVTAWVEFYLACLASEVDSLKTRVARLVGEPLPKDRQGRQLSLSDRQIALMEVFQTREELTMNEARSILPSVSDDTILRDLSSLLKKKLIRKKGRTKGAKYVLAKAVL